MRALPLVALALALTSCQTVQSASGRARGHPLLRDWPAEAEPHLIGRRLVENWLARDFLFQKGAQDRYGKHLHYAEVATWYGALNVASLLPDRQLNSLLIRKFDTMLREHGADRLSQEAHVDFSIAGALPLEIYLRTKNPVYLPMGREFADRQWASAGTNGITAEARYWADDMYMVPLLQLQAYRATGRPEYLDRTAHTMVVYLDSLQQPNGLFHHGPGSPFYWGRGNGWIAAGMTELLRSLPPDHQRHAAVLAGYRKMMSALRTHQSPEGLWRQLIDRPELWLESSGSAMFAFAISTGVNEGWLDGADYAPIARRAWLALVKQLDASANLRDICVGTGKALGEVGSDLDAQYKFYVARPRSTGDLHGQAPMLWAAAALLRP